VFVLIFFVGSKAFIRCCSCGKPLDHAAASILLKTAPAAEKVEDMQVFRVGLQAVWSPRTDEQMQMHHVTLFVILFVINFLIAQR
jgi:hypothetical protein